MTRLILVRHGETVWNAEGRIQGHTDVPLSDRGMKQAKMVAQRLAGVHLSAVYSSDLLRARATAEIIAVRHGVAVRTTDALREAYLGEWQGLTVAEAAEQDADLVALWKSDSVAHRPPRAERLEDVQARAVSAVQQIIRDHPNQTVAVVSHGGPIKSVICWAIGAPLSSIPRMRMDNGAITCIRADAVRVQVEVCNDTCHLRGEAAVPVF